jgi:hypothetical protein
MPRIGITGHTNLTPTTISLVTAAIRACLEPTGLVGVTCLAQGADQIFARVVLELGGSVEVVLPAADYRAEKVKPANLADFDELLNAAAKIHTMPFAQSNPDAYLAASEHLLATVDALIAVWDGEPGNYGGTGDVVTAAHKLGLPVTIIWPKGATRG